MVKERWSFIGINRHAAPFESKTYSYSTTWISLSYPSIENKLIFKSASSLAYLGNSSYGKGINHTASLKQKKLSHLNAWPCFTRGNEFAFADTKTKGSLHWVFFCLLQKNQLAKTKCECGRVCSIEQYCRITSQNDRNQKHIVQISVDFRKRFSKSSSFTKKIAEYNLELYNRKKIQF